MESDSLDQEVTADLITAGGDVADALLDLIRWPEVSARAEQLGLDADEAIARWLRVVPSPA